MSLDDQAMIDALPDLDNPENADAGAPADAPVTPTPEPQPVSLDDDALVEVVVDGEPRRLPWKEARSGIMMHGAFTKKTQSLAEQRRELEAQQEEFTRQREQVAQQWQVLQQIRNDPAKLAPLLLAQAQEQAKRSQQTQQQQPLTQANIADVQRQFQMMVHEQVQQQMEAFRRIQAAETIEKDLDSFTGELLKDDPVLSRIKGISDVIYGQVEKMGPKDVSEAKDYIRAVVQEYRESVGATLTEEQKRAVAAKAKGTASIEPKGGAPVVPKARAVKKMADLDQEILEFLDQQEKA